MKILAVIPARGGSKGIPRKNLRLMDNKPLIFYAINNAKRCERITDVVVTSDDNEILDVALNYGVEAVKRDPSLSDDKTTLDPVIYDATVKTEKIKGYSYDIVITLQPTSPLLKPETLNNAIDEFIKSNEDTYISVVNSPHLAWSKNSTGFYPLYKERLNRQQLPPYYLETGAFFITKRQYITVNSRMGKNISIYEVSENESTDIDTVNDWIVCENQLKRKKIVLRADGYKKLGMGHIYHCLTLAYQFIAHDIVFVTNSKYKEGLDKIRSTNFPYVTISNDEDFFKFLDEYKPDVIVNDCLDTSKEYIKKLKTLSKRVVTIEDLGAGAESADAVINALYADKPYKANVYSGEKYVCLRDEFILEDPIEISDKVSNVLVIFGGTDPSNLTEKIYRLALDVTSSNKDIKFTFLTALSYDCKLHNIYPTSNIEILSHSKRITKYMKQADLAFTSQGRTVHELACMGIPSIVLAQNEREQLHTFAHMENGFLNLGLGSQVEYETIKNTFNLLINTPGIRRNMHSLMLKHDLRSGVKRIKNIILGE